VITPNIAAIQILMMEKVFYVFVHSSKLPAPESHGIKYMESLLYVCM